ncbi:hypothetical protein LNQ81_04735 [Myroides sp. M-43]|uniref:hypothetical protein n=1 Tax=Myroides oncorhynchi TaxID=2893756 RepID=UPI001E5BF31A|nr:hypothetical protein [Myroides oncorhynchi]MCC9042008.1 hypothetical protein [Myroides oncorhynchi]
MKRNLMLLTMLVIGAVADAQVHIPFRLTTYNNMLIKTVVNERDSLNLMFQVAMDDGAISPEATAKVVGLKFDKEGYSASNKVQIAGTNWENVSFINNQYSGQESDGKIGMLLFKDKVLEINYDSAELVRHEVMPSIEGYVAIPVKHRNGAMFIDVVSEITGESYTHPFYLQSGYAGAMLYDDIFSEKNVLSEKLVTISERELKNSAGKSVITKTAEVSRVSVGGFELNNVAVGYFVGELKNQSFSLFGADMMKRFNWIINADRTMAWIKPSKHYNEVFFRLD